MEYAPKILSWNVTKRCNLRCAHCYLSAGEAGQGEFTTEESLRVVDQAARAGTEMLILSGGEPLLRKDIFEIAAYASAQGIAVVLGTSGILINDGTVRQFRQAGVQGVGISIDAASAPRHDAFRGVPGAWDRAVTGIRRCVSAGVPVLVQMTVTPWNFEEVPDVLGLASDLGAAGFTLYFLVCTGRGETLSDITPEQYEQALAFLVHGQARYPDMLVRARCAPHIRRLAHEQGSALAGSAGCLAGTFYGRITPEGQVTPCPYLPVPVGDLKRTSLEEIWAHSPVLQRLRSPQLGGRCGVCEYQPDCGGCRARAYAVTGDLLGEDPFCSYQPTGEAVLTPPPIAWNQDALARLQRVPGFVRDRVRQGIEGFARSRGAVTVDMGVMDAALEALGTRTHHRRPPRSPGPPD